MNPAGQAHQFFNALLGGNGELLAGCRLTVTSLTPKPRTRWVPLAVDSLASAVAAADGVGVTGVYIGVGLTRSPGPDAERLTVDDTVGIAFVCADIDILGAGHDERNPKPYAPDLGTALSIANSLGLRPTVVVHTGHGIQAYWRLDEPWIFGAVDVDDDGAPVVDPARVTADREAAKALTWEFVTSIRIRARLMGDWHVDPTGDLARLMRSPGSANRKIAGENLPVHILEGEGDPARRYTREDLEAVIAPRALLDPYRVGALEATADLAGVDLAGLWAQVQTAPEHTPRWLASVLDSGFDDALCRIWSGEEDASRYHNDDSEIDMALVAAVLRLELGAARAAQAVMARRVRVGRKVEKVDPAERVDYLARTVGKVAARIRAKTTAVSSGSAVLDEALGSDDDPDPDDPPADVGASGATPSEPAPSVVTPLRRPDPTLESDPEVEHAQAPRAPRPGIDPSTPAPPNAAEKNLGAQLGAQMGLPAGMAVWAVGWRRMDKVDEIRMWLYRTAASVVHGGSWQPNTVAATRWHPKSEWEVNIKMAGILWRDLHVATEPVPARAWRDEGRTRLYQLARRLEEGTPAETTRQALIGMLRRAQGTAMFATAVVTRDPWVDELRVWVALDSVRQAIAQAGFPVASAVRLMDTLDEMGCKVQTGMAVAADHRTVCDELPWVLLVDSLCAGELGEHVRLRAADRDAQDARAGLRLIGPS